MHISNYQGDVTITPIVKHYPPDTAAAFIWLKNRAGWRDKQEVDHTVAASVQSTIDVTSYSEDERRNLFELIDKGRTDADR